MPAPSNPRAMELDAAQLEKRIDGCLLADQRRLRARIRGLTRRQPRRGRGPRNPHAILEQIAADIDASQRRLEHRRQALPKPSFPDDLPVAERREEIADAITNNQVVVICGETGSGKTTQIPKICLSLGRGVNAMIGHTQPRRIAARSVATRIAEELRSPLGQAVGYKIRFGDQTTDDTFVKLMTDGILLAETQSDRFLDAYDTIIIDEAHERSLNIDFLLGILHRLLPKRPDLKLIITSATIDPQRFSAHFHDAPIIEVSGRTYPVEVRYRPLTSDDAGDPNPDPEQAILDAVDELARHDSTVGGGARDVLVFLPGEREIRETAEALRKHHPPGTEILPLYARLSADEQMKAFKKHTNRRIVLATNVAETSLTVPGIRYVIDTGVARLSRYSPRSRIQRLPVEPISQASANQRKGRCGREAPGVCIRLYDEPDFESRPEHTDPEILRANLAAVILTMKSLRLGDVSDFPFIDPPDHALIHAGYETLHEIGAVDDDGHLTDLGHELARMPVDPSVGRMILAASKENALAEVLVIAAALSVQDPRDRPFEKRAEADAAHERFADPNSDFLALLNIWNFFNEQKRHLSRSKLRLACRQNFLSHNRMREWIDVHRQLLRLVTEMGHHPNKKPAEPDAIHRALLTGLLHYIGRLDERGEYKGARGSRFFIFPGSGLFSEKPKWIMAAELVRTTKLYARTVARIDPAWIERLAPHLVRKNHADPRWDPRTARVLANERVTLFGLEIVPRRLVNYAPINPAEARTLFIHHALVEGEFSTKAPFFKHNADLLEHVRSLQHKGRRTDLLADTHARFAFFDARLPGDIASGGQFERWRRQAEKDDPRLLFLSEDDLLTTDVSDLSQDRFPDALSLRADTIPLEYRYEPGADDDGLTMNVTLDQLARLDERDPQWLVPGMLEEKVTALIRALPKDLRKSFVPAPDVARRVAADLSPDQTDLFGAVAARLGQLAGTRIDPALWSNADIPDHLRMNFRVIDAKGKFLDASRDLTSLRAALGVRVDHHLATADDRFHRDAITSWDFGDLPTSIETVAAGQPITAHPAVEDHKTAVALRLLTDPTQATAASRRGMTRLVALSIGQQIRHLVESQPTIDTLRLHFAPIGSPRQLTDQLTDAIAMHAAGLGSGKLPRTPDEFEARLDQAWNNLSETLPRVVSIAAAILEQHHAVDLILDSNLPAPWQPVIDDVDTQIANLVHPTFLTDTPLNWLAHIPRFFAAIRSRLDKLRVGAAAALERDRALIAEVRPWAEAWSARAADHHQRGIRDPELTQFRWMIEEFRVSLFAQELGTSLKVSPQRLDKQWHKTRP